LVYAFLSTTRANTKKIIKMKVIGKINKNKVQGALCKNLKIILMSYKIKYIKRSKNVISK